MKKLRLSKNAENENQVKYKKSTGLLSQLAVLTGLTGFTDSTGSTITVVEPMALGHVTVSRG